MQTCSAPVVVDDTSSDDSVPTGDDWHEEGEWAPDATDESMPGLEELRERPARPDTPRPTTPRPLKFAHPDDSAVENMMRHQRVRRTALRGDEIELQYLKLREELNRIESAARSTDAIRVREGGAAERHVVEVRESDRKIDLGSREVTARMLQADRRRATLQTLDVELAIMPLQERMAVLDIVNESEREKREAAEHIKDMRRLDREIERKSKMIQLHSLARDAAHMGF
jgi:hypothetical protein